MTTMWYYSIIGFLTLKCAFCNHEELLKAGIDGTSINSNSQITFLSPVEPNEDITSIKGLSADRSSKFLSLILENNKDQWLHPSEASRLPADDKLFETKELRKAKDRKIPPSSWNLSNNFGFGSEAVLNTPQSGFNYYDQQIAGHVEHVLKAGSDDTYHNETTGPVDIRKNDSSNIQQTTTKALTSDVIMMPGESDKIQNTKYESKTPNDMSEIKIDGFHTSTNKTKTLTNNPQIAKADNALKDTDTTPILTDPKLTETVVKEISTENGNKLDISEKVISRIIYPAQLFSDLPNNNTAGQIANEKPETLQIAQENTTTSLKGTQPRKKTENLNSQPEVNKSNITEPGTINSTSVIDKKQLEKSVDSENTLITKSSKGAKVDEIPQLRRNNSQKDSIHDQAKEITKTLKQTLMNGSVTTKPTRTSNEETPIIPEKDAKPTLATDTREPLVDLSKVLVDNTNESKAMTDNQTKTVSKNLEQPRIPIKTQIHKEIQNNETSLDTVSEYIPKVSGAPLLAIRNIIQEKGDLIDRNPDQSKDIVVETKISEINEPPSRNLEHKMSYRTKQGPLEPQKLILKSPEVSINTGNLHPPERMQTDHRTNSISGKTAEGRRRSEALDAGYQKRMGNIHGIDPKDSEQPKFVEWLAKLRRQKQKRLKDSEKAKKWAIDKTFGIKSKSQPLHIPFNSQSFRSRARPKYTPTQSQPCNETELETMQLAVKILTLLLRKVEKLSEPIRSNIQSSPRSFRRPLGTRRRYLLTPVDIVLPKNRKNFKQQSYPPTPQRDHLRRNPQKFYSENSVMGDNHRRNPKYFPGNSLPMEEKFHHTDRKYFSENPPREQRKFEQRENPKYYPNEQNPEGYPLEPPADGQSSYSLGKGQYPVNYAYQ